LQGKLFALQTSRALQSPAKIAENAKPTSTIYLQSLIMGGKYISGSE
jgi:hypothetical protein